MTSPARDELAAEFRRLAGVASVITAVARYVDDLVQLPPEQAPNWIKGLGVPSGWRLAALQGAGAVPTRIALCGQRPDGRWDGCETISIFGFTGDPPAEVVRVNADSTLRDLGAEDIQTQTLAVWLVPRVTAVRSHGYVTAVSQHVWAQYSTYVVSAAAPGEGRLIQQSISISAGCRTTLSEDIAQLGTVLQQAFFTSIE
jgi:hypothetical protein